MALSNSSIHTWLDYNLENPLPILHPCAIRTGNSTTQVPSVATTNCSLVCTNNTSLFDPATPDNLVHCGIWTSVVSNWQAEYEAITAIPDALLDPFRAIGLNRTDALDISAGKETFGSCFSAIYALSRLGTIEADGSIAASCTSNNLFPNDLSNSSVHNTTGSIANCVDAICTPATLNPDIGGIGVYLSFVIQNCTAMLALIAFFGLELSHFLSSSLGRDSTQSGKMKSIVGRRLNGQIRPSLLQHLIRYNIAQCYSAGSVQIAALVLLAGLINSKETPDYLDAESLVTISTTGLVPVIFTLTCIARYNRISFYLLMLSWLTLLLATATLACISFFWNSAVRNPTTSVDDLRQVVDNQRACGMNWNLNDAAALCGFHTFGSIDVHTGNTNNGWIWVMWANCVVWAVLSTIRQRFRLIKLPNRSPASVIRRLHTILFYALWTICFVYQTYLYSLYFNRSLISMTWSFGQIVAILIFAPTLVELIYSEFQTWKFEVRLSKRYQKPNDDTPSPLNAAVTLGEEKSSRENIALINASHEHPSNSRQPYFEDLAAGKRRMPGTRMRAHSL